MTEKDLKKMKHFLGNKNDSDMEEVISYIQKKEQKQGITALEWKDIFEIACERTMAGLQKWILENKMQLGEEDIKSVSIIVDRFANRLDLCKKMADMTSELLKHFPEKFKRDVLGIAFVLACKNNNLYLIKFLLEQGCDVNYCYDNKTGMEEALAYSESVAGNGDRTLYKYLQRNQNINEELEDVEKFYIEKEWMGKVYTPDKNSCEEYKNKLLSPAARKRAEFVANEYDFCNLLERETTEDVLATFMEEYNWDDGLEIPYFIARHENCELATALRIFWEGEGIIMLEEGLDETDNKEWKYLLETVYQRILDGVYPQKRQHYKIPINGTCRYKLKKKGVADIFLNDL